MSNEKIQRLLQNIEEFDDKVHKCLNDLQQWKAAFDARKPHHRMVFSPEMTARAAQHAKSVANPLDQINISLIKAGTKRPRP